MTKRERDTLNSCFICISAFTVGMLTLYISVVDGWIVISKSSKYKMSQEEM